MSQKQDLTCLSGATCTDLQQYVSAVVKRHHDGSNTDVVWNPGEAQKSQRGCMMNHLLFEVLLSHRWQEHVCEVQTTLNPHRKPRSDVAHAFKHTHLPFHVRGQTEEQGDVEAQLHYVIPVLRRQHGLHKGIENRNVISSDVARNCCRGIKVATCLGKPAQTSFRL